MNHLCESNIQDCLDSQDLLEKFIEHAAVCQSCAKRYDELGEGCFGIDEVINSFDIEAFYVQYSLHCEECEKCRKTKECLEESGVPGLKTLTLTNAFQESSGIPEFYRPLLVGNRFFLNEKIGSGGFGSVFSGYDSRFQSQVAVKLTRSRFGSAGALSNEEANSLLSLHHQGIVNVFDYGHTDICDTPFNFISMEKVTHQDLLKYCLEHKLSVEETLNLFHDICEALSYAHRHKVFHRDIKPSNVLVQTEQGKTSPRLIDFGIAVQGDRISSSDIAGTPNYMNLEKLDRDPGETDHSDLIYDDIYSLGLVLYQCLTKKRNLPEAKLPTENGNWIEIQKKRIASIAESIKKSKDGFPDEDLHSIVVKAISSKRDCYESVESLADDIKRYLDHYPVKARKNTLAVQFKKYCQRQPVQAIMGVSIVILLTLSSIVGWVLNSRLAASNEKVVKRLGESMQLLSFINNATVTDMKSGLRTTDVRDEMLRKIQEYYSRYLNSGDVDREEYLSKKQDIALRYSEIGDPKSAISIYEELIDEYDPNDKKENWHKSQVFHNLAGVYLNLRKADEALHSIHLSQEILKQMLADGDDQEVEIKLAFSNSLNAIILKHLGKQQECVGKMKKGVEELKSLSKKYPEAVRAKQLSVRMILNLDNQMRDLDIRKKLIDDAYEINEKLLANATEDPTWENQMARLTICDRLGGYYFQIEQLEMAVKWYREAIKIGKELAKLKPNNIDVRLDLARVQKNAYQKLVLSGNVKEAESEIAECVRFRRFIAQAEPNNLSYQLNLANALLELGEANLRYSATFFRGWTNFDDAIQLLEKLYIGDPNNTEFTRRLGKAYLRFAESISEFMPPEQNSSVKPEQLMAILKLSQTTIRRLDEMGVLNAQDIQQLIRIQLLMTKYIADTKARLNLLDRVIEMTTQQRDWQQEWKQDFYIAVASARKSEITDDQEEKKRLREEISNRLDALKKLNNQFIDNAIQQEKSLKPFLTGSNQG